MTLHRRTGAGGTPVHLIPLVDPHLSTATCRPPLVDSHLSTSRLSAALHLCSSATQLSDLARARVRTGRLSAAIHLCPPQLAYIRRNSLMSPSCTRRRRGDRYRRLHRRRGVGETPVRLIHLTTPTCRPPLVDPHLSTSRLSAAIHLCSSATHLSDLDTHTRPSKSFVRRNKHMSAATRFCPP
jgi:hypothetical protein